MIYRSLDRRRIVMAKLGLPAIARTAATAAAGPVATAPGSALGFRPGFVDVERPAIEFSAVQFRDCAICFGAIGHLNKSKPSGSTGIPVRDEVDTLHGAVLFKQRS